MRDSPDPRRGYFVPPDMRPHPLELAISPSVPPFEQEEPRPRAGSRRLFGPLGLSVALHTVALAVAVNLVVASGEPNARRSRAVDVAAFVEISEGVESEPAEDIYLDEASLEEDDTPLMPEEILPLTEVDTPSEEREDVLPEFPEDREVVEQPLAVIDVPLHAARARRPEAEAAQAPEPIVKAPPNPAPSRMASRPAATSARSAGAPLRVQSRPNVLNYYPLEARRRGIEGRAIVLIEVDRRGIVIDAKVIESSGSGLLDRQAVRYLYDMRFQPGSGGKTKAPVHFRLR